MIEKKFLNWIENEKLTHEEAVYLLDKLCSLATKSVTAMKPKVEIYLKSKSNLEHVDREHVASYLDISSRTLSRRLKKENTGFQKLLDSERKRRCLIFLQDSKVCGQEIVELLGLSDCSHFYRAFKRWTGTSFSEVKSKMAENNCKVDTNVHRQSTLLHR
jgi:AraC-like DNA-binding protein